MRLDQLDFTAGAGATFSAGYIYGHLHGWNLEDSVRFAIAAASLKVTRAGLQMFPIQEIKAVASTLKVEYLTFDGNQFLKLKEFLSFPKPGITKSSRPKRRQ